MKNAFGKQILVVDDDAQVRALLTVLLEDEGYQVQVAVDGEEALLLTMIEVPDLILLDTRMPKMDGIEAYTQLQANAVTRGIPVIFLTGSHSKERLDEVLDLGANDILGKPINAVELTVRIRAMLHTRNIPDATERLGEYIKTMDGLRAQAALSAPRDLIVTTAS